MNAQVIVILKRIKLLQEKLIGCSIS